MSTEMLCTFRSGGRIYGVPASAALEALDGCSLHPVPLAPEWVAGVLAHRGGVLEVISLRALLGLPRESGLAPVLILQGAHPGERFGVAVDAIEGVEAAEEQALDETDRGAAAAARNILAGVSRVGGERVLVLNAAALAPDSLSETHAAGFDCEEETGVENIDR